MAGDDDLLNGPRWRTRSTARTRHLAAVVTFLLIAAVGLVEMVAVWALLDRVGAPGWVAVGVWLVPMAAVLTWSLARPSPAMPTDDDEIGWLGFAICFVLVGETEPRPQPIRVLTAVLLGAPTGWMIGTVGILLILVGLV